MTRAAPTPGARPLGLDGQLSRRRLMAQLWGLTGWALVAGSWALVHRTLTAAPVARRRVVLSQALLNQAQAEGGLIAGELFLCFAGAQPVALSTRCTHLGCTLTFNRRTSRLRCPCHGSHFDLDGFPAGGPATQPLVPIPLQRRDGVWQALLDEPLATR